MELFNYLLKVSACSALFFAVYLIVLRKLTFFKINRFYLLGSLLISFIIPTMQFTVEREVAQTEVLNEPVLTQQVELTSSNIQAPITFNTTTVEQEIEQIEWLSLLPYLYGIVVASLLLLTAWRIFRLIQHTKYAVKEINGLKLVAKEKGFTNCSFFNYVFIDENSLTETELGVLLAHEEVHAKQYHSIDKLVLMIVKAFLFFNPIVYLYDKALEEAHEYEADETTSQNTGTALYASLLLKLAVSKSATPLIHNFVKSPIKQRIKMLFNPKSKNMKKLAYLLALPIGLGLIWGFTVKITPIIKTIVNQETPSRKDELIGKTVKGKVMGFEKLKLGEVLNLQVGSTIIPISSYRFKDKVKIGDEITVLIAGKAMLPPPVTTRTETDTKGNKSVSTEKASYMASKVFGTNGKLIYETPRYAFLYEANRARYAWSNIKSIEKNANGTINKIVLFNKEFTINLNVAAQKFKSDDFKKGDSIVVKFIGEKLTGEKTYTTDKMIAMYSWPKKHELINKTLYPKFYHENGKQKVYDRSGKQIVDHDDLNLAKVNSTPVFPEPVILSSTDVQVFGKTSTLLITGAKMKIFNGDLEAEYIEMDNKKGIVTAKGAKFTKEKGYLIKSDLMIFDTKRGTFTVNSPTSSRKPNSAAFELLSKYKFTKSDSIKAITIMDDAIIYTGNIKMKIDNYLINARIISVNSDSNIIKAYLGSLTNGDQPSRKAEMIEFDLITKEIKLDNKFTLHEDKN